MSDDLGLTQPLVELAVIGGLGQITSPRFRSRYERILSNDGGWKPSADRIAMATAIIALSDAIKVIVV